MSGVVRDVGEVHFEQVRSGGGGGVVVMPPGAHLMDDPDVDPAVQAAADVKWLLSQASGLQRLVDLGDEVRGEEDPNEFPHAPQRVSPPYEANSIDTTVTEPSEPSS